MSSNRDQRQSRKGSLLTSEESPLASMLDAGRSGLVLLSSRGVNMVAQFCLVLVISRYMGQEALGIFTFVLSTTILGTFISNFGLDTLVTREVASDPHQGQDLVSNILGLKTCSSAIAFLVVNLVFQFSPLDPAIRHQLLVYSVSIFFISTSQLLWFYGDAFDRFNLHGALWAANHVLKAATGITILLLVGSLSAAFVGLVLAEGAGLLLTWIVINRQVGRLRFTARFDQWWKALKKAWPIAIYGLFGALGFRMDVVILQMLRGSTEVGLYGAAFKLVEVMHVVPSSLSLVYFPRFSRVFVAEGPLPTLRLLKHLLLITISTGLLLCALLYLTAPWVIQLLYGQAFTESTGPLKILVAKILLMFVNLPLSYALIAMGDERQATYRAALSAVVNLGANFLLIPQFGGWGAAWASVLSEVVILLGFGIRLNQIRLKGIRALNN